MVSDHGEEVILYQEKQNKKQTKKKLKNGKLRKYPRPILTEQV